MIAFLTQIPIPIYVGFLTALFTAIATLSGVFLTNIANNQRLALQLNHERQTKQKELMREKLEQLYILFKKWDLTVQNVYINYLRAMKGNITYDTLLKIESERSDKSVDYNRLEMLIDLYFPNIKPA
jgi:hypothetical protein